MAKGKTLWRGAVIATALALTFSPGLASAGPKDKGLGRYGTTPSTARKAGDYQNLGNGKWFVEFNGQPTAAGGKKATVDKTHQGFANTLRKSGKKASVQRTFTTLFNGVTVSADTETARSLTSLPGVKAVYPVVAVAAPKRQASKPAAAQALKLTGVDVAQGKLRLSGKGIKVGIIDSGVDYDHPDLGGSGRNGKTPFPTARVRYGYDFVGDAYNADPMSPTYNPTLKPDRSPDDCSGHGTNVAGILGANGKIKGVAPQVTIGAYRVLGCSGSTDTDVILAALERAQRDGMNVINMSISAGFQSWPTYPTSVASDRLWERGIVVVNAAGNDGDLYTQTLGSPAASDKAIAVASFDSSRLVSAFSSWGLAANLALKPDLGAPGGSINSLLPVERGDGYEVVSGTSMATPHVAGAAALMLQANPRLRPDDVRTRLQNTAVPAKFREKPSEGILDAAHRQGAGLIQVDRAIQSTTLVTPSKLSAGESADGAFRRTLTISNTSSRAATWTLSKQDAVSTDPGDWQNELVAVRYNSRVAFSTTRVRVPARGSAKVTVTIQPDREALQGAVYSGYVVLTSAEGATLRVPFAGMAGDYGKLNVFPSVGVGMPALVGLICGKWRGSDCVDPNMDVYNVAPAKVFRGGKDPATIATHLAYPLRRLTFELIPVVNGKPDERRKVEVKRLDYVGRSPLFNLFSWDGKVPDRRGAFVLAAPGRYVLRMTALKADGDGNYQSWTSPSFAFDGRQG
ncbi:MAG: S8 family serine peptidase [Tessaracoccus sp.]|uniref:S8 family peptidase n=1 Tax=Tessaracoccus sp. TaxID=1971211 RepID=UPI001EC967FF|nr:S8 family serine peptidase [Tessaracoccus sp.]MBK7820015.1 S8 family serine peptidase [Tessaracoccus sp.]